MIKVGLTGNIGSGKSIVAGIFEVLGIPVYHADAEAKKILDLPATMHELRGLFGDGVIADGRIDRRALADIVFADPEALKSLNAVVHPRVREDLVHWINSMAGHPYIVQEAAILFESGFHTFFDATIVVTCPEKTAVDRVMKRDGVSEKEVRNRMRNQWPQEKKAGMADYIILNDGSQLVIPQVLAIHSKLLGKD